MPVTDVEKIQLPSPSDAIPNTTDTYRVITDVQAYLHSAEELLNQEQKQEQQYDIREDFDWFTSGQLDTSSYKDKYIAIWKKQVVASGDTALEAESLAKLYFGEACRPAIVYIPEDPLAIL